MMVFSREERRIRAYTNNRCYRAGGVIAKWLIRMRAKEAAVRREARQCKRYEEVLLEVGDSSLAHKIVYNQDEWRHPKSKDKRLEGVQDRARLKDFLYTLKAITIPLDTRGLL